MGILKLASEDTVRLDLGEGDYLEVREGVSKEEYRSLLDQLPANWEEGFTPGQADDFSTRLFSLLVRGWSIEGVEANADTYQKLQHTAAQAVDTALMGHFNGLTPSQEERSKSKGNSK